MQSKCPGCGDEIRDDTHHPIFEPTDRWQCGSLERIDGTIAEGWGCLKRQNLNLESAVKAKDREIEQLRAENERTVKVAEYLKVRLRLLQEAEDDWGHSQFLVDALDAVAGIIYRLAPLTSDPKEPDHA